MDLLEQRLTYLRDQKGFSPAVIYDVGAHVGEWARAVKAIFPSAQIHSFEANEEHAPQLLQHADVVHIGVVGDRNKTVPFYSISNTGDSLLPEKTQWYEGVEPKELKMQTIDSLKLPPPQLLKCDLGGAELLVLKGGKETFAQTEVVILEVKILEYNEGAPTFAKTIKFMDDRGYAPLEITELHYLPSGELNEVDVIFAKKDSPLIKTGLLA